jgi:hypothetical protein
VGVSPFVASNELAQPSQRLYGYTNHFMDNPLYAGEHEQIRRLANELPHVRCRSGAPGWIIGYYSGEDVSKKASMMAYSDVF